MLKLLKLLVVSAVLTTLFASAAMAQEVVADQGNTHENQSTVGVDETIVNAQTITTGTGGELFTAYFWMTLRNGMDGNGDVYEVCFDLHGVANGRPGDLVGSIGCVSSDEIPFGSYEWVTVQPSRGALPYLSAGQQYAIVVHSYGARDDGFGMGSSGTAPNSDGTCPRDDYAGGMAFSGTPSNPYDSETIQWSAPAQCGDFLFKTDMIIDETAPTGTVLINNGATRTTTRTATLNLSATDPEPSSGVTQMRFKNAGTDTVWTAWEPYATSRSWQLTAGEEYKKVYAQFKDAAGNRSTAVYDTINFKRY